MALKIHGNPLTLKSKKIRSCKHPQLDFAVAMFVQQARDNNIPLSGTFIQQKGRLYAAAMSIENFKGSNDWLKKFTKSYGISIKTEEL
jgi:hypothetical protein